MTVLNSYPIYYEAGYTWGTSIIGIIVGILSLGLAFFSCILFSECETIIGKFLTFIFIIMVALFTMIAFLHSKPAYKEVTRYEVILDDDINFKEFYDKYNIIEAKGQLYVIEEREN